MSKELIEHLQYVERLHEGYGGSEHYSEAAATIKSQAAEIERLTKLNGEFLDALKKMNRAYVSLMESGRDRIIDLGGECDPLEVMERNDPNLRDSRSVISSAKEQP